jgi:RNA polymerase sigma-70 factor (ECF subfamily)
VNDTILIPILSRIAGGDRDAVQDLFRRTQRHLMRMFYRLSRRPDLSEDLLQGTYLRLWRYRGRYRGQSARSYIYRIALNEWRDSRARERRMETAKDGYARCRLEPEAPTPDLELQRDETRRRVRAAVDALPDAQREVFILHRIEGLSCREIAGVLGRSPRTIESRLRLGLEKLTAKLRAEGGPP